MGLCSAWIDRGHDQDGWRATIPALGARYNFRFASMADMVKAHEAELAGFIRRTIATGDHPISQPKSPIAENRARAARLGFRVDERTKTLVERAAQLEPRKVTDFCLTALTEAAQRTIARHETLSLSDEERATFFDALVKPPPPNGRLKPAIDAARRRVAP